MQIIAEVGVLSNSARFARSVRLAELDGKIWSALFRGRKAE
jgi:hypothetical protein